MRNQEHRTRDAFRQMRFRVAVKALIPRIDQKILLVRRSRLPESAHPLEYNLPGGAVEPGETLIEALKREVVEETGLEVSIEGVFGIREWRAVRHNAHYIGVFIACKPYARSPAISLNYENSEYMWATAANMRDLNIIESSRSILEEFFSAGDHPLLPYLIPADFGTSF
jgi:8-oxo-dGTP diphosphatase